MQKFYIFVCLIFMANLATAQQSKLAEAFTPLVGHTWIADTVLADQSRFKQHCTFEFDLDKNLVLVSTDGFINKQQTQWGKRNHGIRYFDPNSNEFKFGEYDVFGGATQGRMIIEADDIYYTYTYNSEMLTDAWIKISDDQYNFKVGVRENGNWEKLYIEADFTRKPTEQDPAYRMLDFWLGNWDVYDNTSGKKVGYSQITSIIDGKGIQEKSHSADGKFHGIGISKFNPETSVWDQMWIDNSGTTILLEGENINGEILFTNQVMKGGKLHKTKVNWHTQSDGSIRQVWSISEATKEDWKQTHDVTYRSSEK